MADVNININIQDEIAKGTMVDFTKDVDKALTYIADKAKLSTSAFNDLRSSIISSSGPLSDILARISSDPSRYSYAIREATKDILTFRAGNEEFLKSLEKVKPAVEQTIPPVETFSQLMGGQATSAVKGFITQVLGLGVIGGVGLQIGREFAAGISSLINSTAEASREISKLASVTGMSIEETQVFSKVAEFSGESASSVASMMRTLSRALEDNTGTGKTAQKAIESLGVSYRDVHTGALLPMDQIFESIIQRLNALGPGAEATKDAVEGLGRAGINILPLVSNFDELKGIIGTIGSTLDSNQLNIGERFRLQSFIFHEGVVSMKNDIGSLVESLFTLDIPDFGKKKPITSYKDLPKPDYKAPFSSSIISPTAPDTSRDDFKLSKTLISGGTEDNNKAVDVALSNLNPKLAAAEATLNELRSQLKKDVLPEVNAPILSQIEEQKKIVDAIKESLKKQRPGPLDRSDEVADQNQVNHYAALASMAKSGIDAMLQTERGAVQERLQLIDSPYARNVAIAALEVELARKKAQQISVINAGAEQREIAALERKKADIPAGDKTQAADVERIEGQIQSVKDRYAEADMQLAQGVAKAKANQLKIESEEARKFSDELLKTAEETQKQQAVIDERHASSATATNKIIEEEERRHATAILKIDEQTLQARLDLGLITERQLLTMKQKALDEEYKAQLIAIQKEQDLLDTEVPDKNSDLYKSRSASINSKKSQIVDTYSVQSATNATVTLKNEIKQIGQFLDPISSKFSSALSQWVTGTKSFGQAFSQMTQGIVTSWVNSIALMAAKWAEHQATKLIIHVLTNAGIIASDITTAATSNAIDASHSLKAIAHAAAVGASKTYASVSELPPPVGTILAPIAAAGAYAAILGFGAISAEGGADLGAGNSFGLLHPHEMVLPQKYADVIRNMSNSGNTNNRSTRIGQVNYNAKSTMGQREFRDTMNKVIRNSNR